MTAEPGGDLQARLDEGTRQRIRALPGSLTYLDLIRKNRRASAVLMVVMVLTAVVIGGMIGASTGVHVDLVGPAGDVLPPIIVGARDLLPSVVVGGVVALCVALIGTAWSWFDGASAILRLSGARQIVKEQDPELWNVVEEMAIAGGVPVPKVFLIDDSAMNAFATGRDPQHGVICVTSGLRGKLSRDELQGVIAHEMSHIRHLDIRFSMLMATMVGLIAFACDAFLRISLRGGFRGGRGGRGKGGGAAVAVVMIIALVLAILAPFIARLIQMAYSRQREYLADAGSVELTRHPEGLASALQKLADDAEPLVDGANRGTAHMFIVNPLRKMREARQSLDSAFCSHPPIQERIARLMALAR